jgi:hypothetical protein
VEDHAGGRIPGGDGVAQRIGDQAGPQVIGHRVSHDPAGGDVDDGGQEQPPFPGAQVGDIAAPAGVQLGGARETFSSSHARLTLRCCAFSASMNG